TRHRDITPEMDALRRDASPTISRRDVNLDGLCKECGKYRYRCSFSKSSAICTLFKAAPLRTLSETIHRSKPRGCEMSSRMRPTHTGSLPAPSTTAVG